MKHGRRHSSLKEKTYRDRFHQGAEGYARPYDALDVREGTGTPEPREEPTTPLAQALPKKARRQLKRLGLDAEEGP